MPCPPGPIEDYALIGDCGTAALVARTGSIDWLCFPGFDSSACFAALLGTEEHGRWLVAPAGEVRAVRRRYLPGTLVLETEFDTAEGTVALIDFMPPRGAAPELVRIVAGRRGRVEMAMELLMRFDYGSTVPWVQRIEGGLGAVAGPDRLRLLTPVKMVGENFRTRAGFAVGPGERVPFVLTWHPSFTAPPPALDPERALADTESCWQRWSARCTFEGEWKDAVLRSLITLKALTYGPTGGIVAAVTTSLPERLGGVRNWDYRFCWLRDATFTLYALQLAGYREEAAAWREWLLRAVAGKPSQMQIMYGLAGQRRLPELVLDWLPGYQGAAPVRIGNAASAQFQLDVYGEVMDALHQARRGGLEQGEPAWRLQSALMDFLESNWQEPDEGIWEVRGGRRHFTHSKVMAWVAADRAVKGIERFRLDGPLQRWRRLRDAIRAEVLARGYDAELGAFVQSYGAKELDASLLMIPLVGFLPPGDPRVRSTVAAIERHLCHDGFVARYSGESGVDGLPPGEGRFLACSFWLADNYLLLGRPADARRLFTRLLGLCNDVGLLAEEYDPAARRQLGNFPQAFSHVSLINTARNLTCGGGPAEHRPRS